MVGQYHGPEGSAALAVVAPVWNIIYSLGLLMGIGGSVLFSTIRGKADADIKKSNEYFTASVIGSVILAAVVWLIIILFDRQLLIVFGAQDNTLTLAREYVLPIKFAIPFFLFDQMLAAYLRNDKNPALATGAVLAGGIFNIFGDYFFVFACDMGAFGAGLATACDAVPFLHKEKYSPSCKAGRTCEKIKGDHGDRIFHIFYRRGDGHTDYLIQPSDHGLSRHERFVCLRSHRQHQHLCPVLCLQCGAGVTADHIHELRRRQR